MAGFDEVWYRSWSLRCQVSDYGTETVIRKRKVVQMLNQVLQLPIMEARQFPNIDEIHAFGEVKIGPNLHLLERTGWAESLNRLFVKALELFNFDLGTRRCIIQVENSRLPGGQYTKFPACWPLLQAQIENDVLFLTAYSRSVDGDILPVDMAYLAWGAKMICEMLGSRYTVFQVTAFLGNIHIYVDGEGSDGGIDPT